MTTEREIDVAFALEEVPSAAVYALAGKELDFAVVLRPMRGLTMAEAHYRLLTFLSHEECARVLFVNGDLQPPAPMAGARRIVVPHAARAAAAARALARIEKVAKRYIAEEEELANRPPAAARPPSRAEEMRRVHERSIDAAVVLDAWDAAAVYVVEHRAKGALHALDVFVELEPYSAENVLEAHHRLLEATHGVAIGRITYGSAEQRARYFAHRILASETHRAEAGSRAELRALLARPGAEITVPAAAVARLFSVDRPIALSLERTVLDVEPDPFPAPTRATRKVLLVDEDAATAEPLLADESLDVTRTDDPWIALEILAERKFDLVLCALRIGTWRGLQLYRTATKANPDLAERFYFIAAKETLDAAPASSALGRVLAKPLDQESVRKLSE